MFIESAKSRNSRLARSDANYGKKLRKLGTEYTFTISEYAAANSLTEDQTKAFMNKLKTAFGLNNLTAGAKLFVQAAYDALIDADLKAAWINCKGLIKPGILPN
jgi:hypothetical protein